MNNNIVDDIEKFIMTAKETILPYNELAFNTMLNIVEMMIMRNAESKKVVGYIEAKNNSKVSDEDVDNIMKEVYEELKDDK